MPPAGKGRGPFAIPFVLGVSIGGMEGACQGDSLIGGGPAAFSRFFQGDSRSGHELVPDVTVGARTTLQGAMIVFWAVLSPPLWGTRHGRGHFPPPNQTKEALRAF